VLLEIYEKTTETKLWGPVFVCDYPKEVSPLARQHRDDERLVERFEPVVAGRELGNAYSELVDPVEQRLRFEEQAKSRAAGDDEAMVIDEDYVRALEYGLPPTGGLGIGIDRLVMLLAGVDTIRDVVLFPTLRPEQGPS
jgi:lysyl-tRNA synthetase class 2